MNTVGDECQCAECRDFDPFTYGEKKPIVVVPITPPKWWHDRIQESVDDYKD